MEAIAKQIPATDKNFPEVSIIMRCRNETDTPAAYIGKPKRALDVHDFTNIPTEDPRAALQFCQSLARMHAACPTPVINNSRQLQSVGGIKAAPSTPEHQPELSIFIPVFNEEANINVLHSRLTAVLEDTHIDYEIIFVDDGSNAVSLSRLESLSVKHKRVLVVELARNFGHQVAITAGLDHSQGKVVIE
jgi:polyisoprenyl-phosphate glycosyltransferase